jgi:hypothetical protein
MPDDPQDERPDPIEDVRKGLGLLFRAAKRTIEKLPTKDLEKAVISGAREVGRAIENVTQTIDKQVFRHDPPAGGGSPPEASPSGHAAAGGSPPADGAAPEAPKDGAKADAKDGGTKLSVDDGSPRGPRVE